MSSLQCFCIVVCFVSVTIALATIAKLLDCISDILIAMYKIFVEIYRKWDRG